MKVAFVHSKYDSGVLYYPTGSAMLYSSSYVFTNVTVFNSGVAIQQGAFGSTTEFNQIYYHLPDARYAIYGITSFNLPQNSNTSCSTILIDATLNSIDTYTITTPNINPTDFFFQADIFTVNIDNLCRPTVASGDTLYSQVFTVGKKSYFTVPTQSQQQYILENANSIVADSFVFMFYGADNTNNDTILFKAELPFTGLTKGAPIKLEFGYFDDIASIGTNTSATMLDGTNYDIKLEVNGFVLYQETFTAGLAGINTVGNV